MDKKLVLAVAGAGKTTFIIDSVSSRKERALIVTYTDANYENIISKLREKNDGVIPENVTVYTYFKFLYNFCYKPFLSDQIKANGISYDTNLNRYAKATKIDYFIDSYGRLYSNRIAFLLDKTGVIKDIYTRIEKYFDIFIVDEVQDISGRDFNFLEKLIEMHIDMLFVGYFYQHTYNTSADGNVNGSLFDNYNNYTKRFKEKGMKIDNTTLVNSWRCGEQVCEFVRDCLGIEIHSNIGVTGEIRLLEDENEIKDIWDNHNIIKLHFQKATDFGVHHKNWGETKGEDCYQDVCVLMNKTTMQAYQKQKLDNLASLTRNKLYVATTRAKGNVYFVDEAQALEIVNTVVTTKKT